MVFTILVLKQNEKWDQLFVIDVDIFTDIQFDNYSKDQSISIFVKCGLVLLLMF